MKTERYGLIGKALAHSFSPSFFEKKFKKEGIRNVTYELFPLPKIDEFEGLRNDTSILGWNVTVPYKTSIIPYLDRLSLEAMEIGAVNTIKREKDGLIGYNTDLIGFRLSLLPLLNQRSSIKALVLGTGGASKAICYALNKMDVQYKCVSRTGVLSYEQLDQSILEAHQLMINTTPLGMHPQLTSKPSIPYQYLNDQHILYDLVYNPAMTQFLKLGSQRGAKIVNGLEMLERQAEAAWCIWKDLPYHF